MESAAALAARLHEGKEMVIFTMRLRRQTGRRGTAPGGQDVANRERGMALFREGDGGAEVWVTGDGCDFSGDPLSKPSPDTPRLTRKYRFNVNSLFFYLIPLISSVTHRGVKYFRNRRRT
ncbi:hypothetical protein HN873_056194, partial [Arachis hypogaea]